VSSTVQQVHCAEIDRASELALGALDRDLVPIVQAHIAGCPECEAELTTMSRFVSGLAWWPTDILRPAPSLWGRLAQRIGLDRSNVSPPAATQLEPDWETVAPGITCKLLASDTDTGNVSMLVRLAPGVAYPPHLHAGVEELHLLDGELWIENRKLVPGDYNRAESGTADVRVWSETGCTCVLVTSSHDVLR
jgi:hypothetical protein